MYRKYAFLGAAVLSVAGIFALADSAQAQVWIGGPRWGFGAGRYYYPGYYNPGYYYSYGYPAYYSPRYAYYPAAPVTTSSFYAGPAPVVSAPQQTNAARVQVILPDPAAQVWIDGQKTQQGGMDRLFESPPLTPGKTFNYTIKATWQQNGQEMSQERTVPITAGNTSVVDFTRPAPAQ
jgi:uncharacterized protein (TIGR03000 family)